MATSTVKTKLVEKTVKDSFKMSLTHVSKDGKLLFTIDTRAKDVDAMKAFSLFCRDITTHNGELDRDSVVNSHAHNAVIRYPDGSQAFLAILLSDTQCPLCGAIDGQYNEFCPECQERKKAAAKRGNGTAADDFFAAMTAKDTRRGR